jgi:hypothetical protein
VSASDGWSSYPAGGARSPQPAHQASAPGSPSLAKAALIEFAERGPAATSADVDQVMRSLVNHDSWFVPVEYARQTWGQSTFDQTLPFPDRGPLATLNVFTDPEAAALGEAAVSGDYGGPVSGVTLLQSLDPGLSSLFVNPGSPREHQWYIESGGFSIAASWATAIAVEQALEQWGNGPVPAADLLAHRYHLLVEKDTRVPAQVFLPEIDGVVAVCFTATDRFGEFVASLPMGPRLFADTSQVDGPGLFELVRTMGAAGVVINAGSDDQTALTRDDIAEIVGARL